jgi:hypothetical protein
MNLDADERRFILSMFESMATVLCITLFLTAVLIAVFRMSACAEKQAFVAKCIKDKSTAPVCP